MARLTLISGGPGGKSFTFQTTASIGRATENNIALLDPRVSNRHAQVYRSGNQFFLVDLGSKNGTKVNGALVRANEAVPLATGDRITVAGYTFMFDAEAAAPVVQAMEVNLPPVPPRELESMSKWLRFLGLVSIVAPIVSWTTVFVIMTVAAAFSGLPVEIVVASVFGLLLVLWIPIVLGVFYRGAGDGIRAFLTTGQRGDFVKAMSRLRLLFSWQGVLTAVSIALILLLGIIYALTGLAASGFVPSF